MSHKFRGKYPQQNINKVNPTMYEKNYTLQPSGVYLLQKVGLMFENQSMQTG